MIRNSLYVRFIAAYIVAVLLGVSGAVYYMGLAYKDRIEESLIEQMDGYANDVASIYQMFEPAQADLYMKNKHFNQSFSVRIFDAEGNLTGLGTKDSDLIMTDKADIQKVLDGGIYRNVIFSLGTAEVGVPLRINGQTYALVVSLVDQEWQTESRKIIFKDMSILLIIGSVFVAAAGTFLVRPIKGMKAAAERIAKGEFDIDIKWTRRRDEIGELARSFENMAREVKQMEEMRQSFVSNVSHEIQSPLTSISGFSKTLQRAGLPEDTKQRYLRIIHDESERLSRLSDSLLQLASLDSEHHPFDPIRYDLTEQLREVVLACEPQWSAKGVELRLQLREEVMVYADADQLSQVWTNLIGNSVKFTPSGGSVAVSIKDRGEWIDVIVSDTGCGIRPEEQERIFERFYKADKSRDKKVPGSGLGLAIVKKIVTLHGGSVQAKPRIKGGTEVTVTIPANAREGRKKEYPV